jgi:NAD(P)-dependent dehydrogenase (short-subunit alcohol dehydrogenase family)
MAAYIAAKAGVAALTQALAAELAGDRILVNAVLPSIIDTPANRASMPKADHAAWPKPGELADAIGFLASPENALTSGALVPVYGRA